MSRRLPSQVSPAERAVPVARWEFVDLATGEPTTPASPHDPVPDGTAPSGRLVADFGGVQVEVDREDLAGPPIGRHPREQRFPFDLESPVDYRARARAKAKAERSREKRLARKMPQRKQPYRLTFNSSKAAAAEFYRENELFFDYVTDPIDGLRSWMDGIETTIGRTRVNRKLNHTEWGRKIDSQKHAQHAIEAALQYVFGRSRRRRWDEVEWGLIDALEEHLLPYFEAPDRAPHTRGLYWRPAAVIAPTHRELDALSPEARTELTAEEGAAEVREALEALEDAYARNRDCIDPARRAVVERRISAWRRWVRDPSQIPDYACEPDPKTGGYTCDYPSVAGELRQLRRACEIPYDPNWPKELARAGTPGFPDVSGGPPDLHPQPQVQRPEPRQTVNIKIDNVLYRQELRPCGRPRCRCMDRSPPGHGPYWRAHWRAADGTPMRHHIGESLIPLTRAQRKRLEAEGRRRKKARKRTKKPLDEST